MLLSHTIYEMEIIMFLSIIKKVFFFLLKGCSFIPALIIMYCIFSFSAQDGTSSSRLSSQVSYQAIYTLNDVLNMDLSEKQVTRAVNRIHFYVRKAAHFTEYMLLAMSIALPLYVYGVRNLWLLLSVGIICVGYASLDELHQLFVSGRGASVRDVMIDSLGSFTGIILMNILCYITRKSIAEPLMNTKAHSR